MFFSSMSNMNNFYSTSNLLKWAVLRLSKRCSNTTVQDRKWFMKYHEVSICLIGEYNLWKISEKYKTTAKLNRYYKNKKTQLTVFK